MGLLVSSRAAILFLAFLVLALAIAKNINEYEAYRELNREGRRLFGKLTRRLLHLYRNFASHSLKALHEQGVSTIYLGYPFNIAQDKGNKFTVNLWSYRELMNIICLLYTSPSPRDRQKSRMPSSA